MTEFCSYARPTLNRNEIKRINFEKIGAEQNRKEEAKKAGAGINDSFRQYPIPSATSLAHPRKGPHLDSLQAEEAAEVQPRFSEPSSWELWLFWRPQFS